MGPIPLAVRSVLRAALFLVGALITGACGAQVITANPPQGCIPNGNQITFTLTGVASPCTASWTIDPLGGPPMAPLNGCPQIVLNLPEDCYNVSVEYGGNTFTYGQNPFCVYQRPVPEFTTSLETVCPGACVDFQDASDPGSPGANITTWQWNTGIPGCAPGNVGAFTCCMPMTGGPFAPSLQVTADNGCASDNLFYGLINLVNDPPVAAFTGNLLDCALSGPLQYESTSFTSAGTMPLTYEWTVDPPAPITALNAPVTEIDFPGIGLYDVCLAVENSYGCTATACHVVNIFDEPIPDLAFPGTVCTGMVDFSAVGTLPATPSLVTWDLDCDGVGIANGLTWNPMFGTPGTYSICVHVEYSSTCAQDTTISLVVLDPIEALFSPGDTTVCSFPFHLDFINGSTGSGLQYEWSVTGPQNGNGTSEDFSFDFLLPGVYNVSLEISNAFGCSDVRTIQVVIDPPEITPFSITPSSACAGDDITANFNVDIIPGQAITNYHWDFGDGNMIDLPTDTPPIWEYGPGSVPAPPNTYIVSLTITTADGCTATATDQVSIVPALDPSFGIIPQYHCIGAPFHLCANDPNGSLYVWHFGNATDNYTATSTVPCIDFEFENVTFPPGPNSVVCFDVTLTIYNLNCDTSQTETDALCLWGPMADFEFQQDCASPYTVEFTSTSYAADSLWWDFGDGVVLEGDAVNDAPGILAPTHAYAAEGSYDVCLTVDADTSSCPDTYCQTVHIDEPSANLLFTPPAGCSPLCVQFTPDDPYNISWEVDFGNGATLEVEAWPTMAIYPNYATWVGTYTDPNNNQQNIAVPYGSNFFPACVEYTAMGLYTVTATATNVNGCTDTTEYTDAIEVLSPGNIAGFSYTVDAICPDVVITCDAVYALDNYFWRYRTPGGWGPWTNAAPNGLPNVEITLPLGTGAVEVELQGDQGNCSDTLSQVIAIPTVPALGLTVSVPDTCPGDPVVFATTPVGAWSGFNWVGIVPQPPSIPIVNGAFAANGTYAVCVDAVDVNFGCPANACVNVDVFAPLPAVDVDVIKDLVYCTYDICVTDTADCPGCSYSWIFNNITTGLTSSPCSDVPFCCQSFAPGIIDVVLTVTALNECDTTVVLHDLLGLGDVLGPWTQTGDTVTCPPMCITFTAFNTNLPGYTYSWAFGDNFSSGGGNGPVVQHCYTQPGTYWPSLTLYDPDGCPAIIDPIAPIVVEPYDVQVNYDPVICAGDTAYAEFTVAAPFGINSISFAPGGGITALSSPFNYALTPGDTIDYIATATFAQCTDEDTLQVAVNPLPVLIAQPFGPFCINDAPLANPIVITSSAMDSEQWTWPGGSNDPMVIGSPGGIVGYSFTDVYDCTSSIDIPFTIHDTTDVIFDPIHACIDAPALDLNAFANHPGGTFQTDYGGGWVTLPTFFDPSAIVGYPLSATNYPVSYSYTNAFGCTSINDTVVTIHPIPVVNFLAPDVCAYDPLEITNTSVIGSGSVASWTWDITGQGPLTTQQVGPFNYGPDSIVIALTATSDQGCDATHTDTALVHPVPMADFTVEDDCQHEIFQYTDLSTISWPEPLSWDWRFGDWSSDVGQHPAHSWAIWGTYTDTLIVTSPFGCSDTATQEITVHPVPVNGMTFAPNCFEDSSTVQSTATIPLGSIDSTWWDMEGMAYNGIAATHLFSSAGFFPVTLGTMSDQGCVTEITDTIEIWPLPDVAYTLSLDELCMNEEVEFTDASTIPAPYANMGWQWLINGVPQATGPAMTVMFTDSGSYDVGLIVTSGNGCIDSLFNTAQITVHPLPIAGFFADPAHTGILQPEIQFVDTSHGAVAWNYDLGDGNHSTAQHPLHEYATFGSYVIEQIATTEFGCLDTAWQQVVIDPDLLIYVPNAFTPDGDGVNDLFLPSLDGFAVREYNLTIWDRWGERIFETGEEASGWDGRATGGDGVVQDGVYVWQIDLQAASFVGNRRLRGHVTVLR